MILSSLWQNLHCYQNHLLHGCLMPGVSCLSSLSMLPFNGSSLCSHPLSLYPPSLSLLLCLSACLSVCLPACLLVCLSACLSTFLSVYPSVFCLPVLSVCLYLAVCLSTFLSACLPICLSVCISVFVCLYQCVCVSVPAMITSLSSGVVFLSPL